jgi:hypothetical protein
LVEALYGQVKVVWEERFERRYGLWRSFVDDVVIFSQGDLNGGRFAWMRKGKSLSLQSAPSPPSLAPASRLPILRRIGFIPNRDDDRLTIKWGIFGANAPDATAPTLGPAEPCDDLTVICYDHEPVYGF